MNDSTREKFVRFFNAFGISVSFSREVYTHYSDITHSKFYQSPATFKCEMQMYDPITLVEWIEKANTTVANDEFNKELIANNEVLQQAYDNWIMILALQGGKF
jgi:hypothetical protein